MLYLDPPTAINTYNYHSHFSAGWIPPLLLNSTIFMYSYSVVLYMFHNEKYWRRLIPWCAVLWYSSAVSIYAIFFLSSWWCGYARLLRSQYLIDLLWSIVSRTLKDHLPPGRRAHPLQGCIWPPLSRLSAVPWVSYGYLSGLGNYTVCAKAFSTSTLQSPHMPVSQSSRLNIYVCSGHNVSWVPEPGS